MLLYTTSQYSSDSELQVLRAMKLITARSGELNLVTSVISGHNIASSKVSDEPIDLN